MILTFIFRVCIGIFIHLVLIFIYKMWIKFKKCGYLILQVVFVEKNFFLHWINFESLSKINWPQIAGPIFGFSGIRLFICLLLCQYHTCLDICCFIISEVLQRNSSVSKLFGHFRSWHFYVNFSSVPIFTKEPAGILDWDCINLGTIWPWVFRSMKIVHLSIYLELL